VLAGLVIEAVGAAAWTRARPNCWRATRGNAGRPTWLCWPPLTHWIDCSATISRAVRLARDVGIAAVHRAAPLKRLFMRRAMGG
jgi:hypothetical protein